jgi:hypothetical protein
MNSKTLCAMWNTPFTCHANQLTPASTKHLNLIKTVRTISNPKVRKERDAVHDPIRCEWHAAASISHLSILVRKHSWSRLGVSSSETSFHIQPSKLGIFAWVLERRYLTSPIRGRKLDIVTGKLEVAGECSNRCDVQLKDIECKSRKKKRVGSKGEMDSGMLHIPIGLFVPL